jgi:hypothetical protein
MSTVAPARAASACGPIGNKAGRPKKRLGQAAAFSLRSASATTMPPRCEHLVGPQVAVEAAERDDRQLAVVDAGDPAHAARARRCASAG